MGGGGQRPRQRRWKSVLPTVQEENGLNAMPALTQSWEKSEDEFPGVFAPGGGTSPERSRKPAKTSTTFN